MVLPRETAVADSSKQQEREAMYARILARLEEAVARFDCILDSSSSSSPAPATSPGSDIADSSASPTPLAGAQKVFDEMPSSREVVIPGDLHVMVSHVVYPVTEDVLLQLFGPYGADKVQLLMEGAHVEALVSFYSAHDAMRAREACHGRCIWDGCNVMDIYLLLQPTSDSMPEIPTNCDADTTYVHVTDVSESIAVAPEVTPAQEEPSPYLTEKVFADVELDNMMPTTCLMDCPSKDSAARGVSQTEKIATILSDAIPRKKVAQRAARRCGTVKWVSKVRVGYRPVLWPVRVIHGNFVRNHVLTHIGGCSLFSETDIEFAVPTDQDDSGKASFVVSDDKEKVIVEVQLCVERYGTSARWSRALPLSSDYIGFRLLQDGKPHKHLLHEHFMLRKDQDTRSIDDEGWSNMYWKFSFVWLHFEKLSPWDRNAFSPWTYGQVTACSMLDKMQAWQRGGFSPGQYSVASVSQWVSKLLHLQCILLTEESCWLECIRHHAANGDRWCYVSELSYSQVKSPTKNIKTNSSFCPKDTFCDETVEDLCISPWKIILVRAQIILENILSCHQGGFRPDQAATMSKMIIQFVQFAEEKDQKLPDLSITRPSDPGEFSTNMLLSSYSAGVLPKLLLASDIISRQHSGHDKSEKTNDQVTGTMSTRMLFQHNKNMNNGNAVCSVDTLGFFAPYQKSSPVHSDEHGFGTLMTGECPMLLATLEMKSKYFQFCFCIYLPSDPGVQLRRYSDANNFLQWISSVVSHVQLLTWYSTCTILKLLFVCKVIPDQASLLTAGEICQSMHKYMRHEQIQSIRQRARTTATPSHFVSLGSEQRLVSLIQKLQVPWDPGGAFLLGASRRLEGKPILKEGRMSCTRACPFLGHKTYMCWPISAGPCALQLLGSSTKARREQGKRHRTE